MGGCTFSGASWFYFWSWDAAFVCVKLEQKMLSQLLLKDIRFLKIQIISLKPCYYWHELVIFSPFLNQAPERRWEPTQCMTHCQKKCLKDFRWRKNQRNSLQWLLQASIFKLFYFQDILVDERVMCCLCTCILSRCV